MKDYLEKEDIKHLVIAEMQTDICVETSVRRAVELGYEVTIVPNGHSPFDFDDIKALDEIERVNAELGEIAQVVNAEEITSQ